MSGATRVVPGDGYGPSLLQAMGRYRWAIALAAAAAALLGYFVSTLLPAQYEATATMVLAETDARNETVVDFERQVQQEENRLGSRAVARRAARGLDDVSAGELRDIVEFSTEPDIGVVEVTATGATPERAAEIANAYVAAYEAARRTAANQQVESSQKVLQDQEAALRAEIEELQAQADGDDAEASQRIRALRNQVVALQTQATQMTTQAALFGSGVDEVENAVPPVEPSNPQPVRNAAIAGVVGLVLASGLALWRANVVDRSRLNPSAVLRAPLLAKIPDFGHADATKAAVDLSNQEAVEAYQFLLTSLEYALIQANARSVLITSASPGEGKSLTALHLARALAIQGRKVILVDSDIRGRGLTSLLRADDQPGLVALAEGESIDNVTCYYRISHSIRLAFIPAGRRQGQPSGLLGTERYREAITKITAGNELTIIDSGPLLTVADASAVAVLVAGIVLVVNAHMSQEDLIKVHDRLQLMPTPVLGYVLNRAPRAGDLVYSYHGPEPSTPR